MAGRSLGALTVDLILKYGGWATGMDQSARAAEKSLKRIQSAASGIGTAFKALVGFVSLRGIIAASAEAAKNFAQLENAVKNAGGAAGGRTAADFAKVSEELQGITTFSDDAVQGVQQLLLRFQSIRTDRFDEATKSVLNLATAMGTDADAAAKLLGRALTDPEKGMTALARAGVVFSDSQKKVIKGLVDTGKQAEAQGLILDELGKKFGGAAEAARNTFSGALAGVKNAFDNLLEVDGGLSGATESLNELAKVLQDPGVRAGADALFSVLIRGSAAAAELIGKTVAGLLILFGQGQNEAVNLDNKIIALQESLEHLKQTNPFPDEFAADQIRRKTEELAALTLQYEKLMGLGVGGIGGGVGAASASAVSALDSMSKAIAGIDALLAQQAKSAEEAAKAQEKMRLATIAAGEALTTSLQTPLEKYNAAVAEADRLLTAGVITVETWAQALGAARGDLDSLSSGMLEVNERFKDMNQLLEESLEHFDEDLFGSLTEMEPPDISEALEHVDTELSIFAKRAAENTQDILADGLVNGFDDGIKGMLQSFGKMLQQMAAQAVAANIAEKIFGTGKDDDSGGLLGKWLGGLGSSGTGAGGQSWWEKALGGFASLFGGSRDNGGRGQPGVEYLIGTGAQPERFVPDQPGTFIPAGDGGMQVVQHFTIQAPQGTVSRQTQQQVGAAAARGISGANRRNN